MSRQAIAVHDVEFDQKKADTYDQRADLLRLGLVSSGILLSITPHYHLDPLDFSQTDFNSHSTVQSLVSSPPDDSIFKREKISILDLACGTGLATEQVVKQMSPTSKLIGVDISDGMLSNFTTRFAGDNRVKGYKFNILDEAFNIKHELEAPEEFTEKFDIVFCTLSYHHISDYVKANTQLASLLKPEGYLIVLDFYNAENETSVPQNAQAHEHGNDHGHHQTTPVTEKALRESFDDLELVDSCITTNLQLEGYMHLQFIKNHCAKRYVDGLSQLPQRDAVLPDGTPGKVYKVKHEMIVAIARKKF